KELVGNIQGALLMQKIYNKEDDILKLTLENIKKITLERATKHDK
ncbi:MAG: hypothetical protein RL154_625, partial [Pseudomonadota bacterium]